MISLLLTFFIRADSTNVAAQAADNLSFTQLITQTIDKVVGWGKTGFHYLPNFIVAVCVLIVFYLIGKLLRKLVGRFLRNVTDNHTVIDLIEAVIGVLMIVVGLFLALAIVNLNGIVTTLLAGVGIIGLALGFAFREVTANFISGVIISIRQPIKKGDFIKSVDHFGAVQKINLRCTLIRTTQGQIVYIPNSDVLDKPLINYSQTGVRRIDLECRVSYADNLEKAKQTAIEAIESLDNYEKERPVQLVYDEFGDFSINFKIRFWIHFKKQWDFVDARSIAIMAIKQKFKEEGLTIPFPIRTHDFGIRGGQKFDEMLSIG